VAELVRIAEAERPAMTTVRLHFVHHGDAAGRVIVGGRDGFAWVEVELEAATGALQHVSGADRPPLGRAIDWLYGVHFVRYGGRTAIWLHLVLALAGCVTMLSGNWIWLARREKTRQHPGNRALQRLTVGFSAGLCLAVGVTLLVHRAAPGHEKLVFAAAFVAANGWALVADATTLWTRQLVGAAAVLAAAALWSPTNGVDLALVVVAGALAAAARILGRRPTP
jgi:hypothetical protein